MYSVAVCLSLPRILSQVQWRLLSMVTRYDVQVGGGQAIFERKYIFQFVSTIQVNLEAKIMESAYLYVIFHLKH